MTPVRCAGCDAALARDQRYCLECGTPREPAGERLRRLLAPTAAPVVPEAPAPRGFTPLARARAAALLVLAIGVGSLIGVQAGPKAPYSFASARAPLNIVLPAAPAAPPAPIPAAPRPEAPAADEQPTPDAGDALADADADAAPGDTTPTDGSTAADDDASGTDDDGCDDGAGSDDACAGGDGDADEPTVDHVFVISLPDQTADAFGPRSPATYLSRTLVERGTLLDRYYAVTRGGLANQVALLSGQGPTTANQGDCATAPGAPPPDVAPATVGDDAQEIGQGCVYSPVTGTLMDQLTGNDKTWRAYLAGPDPQPGQTAAPTCHDPFATSRNPFAYFHTIADGDGCKDVTALADLDADLAKPAAKFPNLAWIAPPPGTSDLAAADAFLAAVVPKILDSDAYAEHGLVVVTFDETPTTFTASDAERCCTAVDFPNDDPATPKPPPGGGRVGLLLLGPGLERGKVVDAKYDHFSLLATLEDLFGLPRLGYAARPEVEPFAPEILAPPSDGDTAATR